MDTIVGTHVERVDPRSWDDVDPDLAALTAIWNASVVVDSPHESPIVARQLRLQLQHSWEGPVVDHLLVAREQGRGAGNAVGYVAVWYAHWDNPTLAVLELMVHPDARADDAVAEALVTEALERCRRDSRTSLLGESWRDSWLAGYWERRGWPVASRAAERRLVVADLDPAMLERLRAQAEQASSDYDIEELPLPTPPAHREAMLDVHRAMNDAPRDDLKIDDDEWSQERLLASEAARLARGVRTHRLIARRRSDGAIGGFTELMVDPLQPEIGDQGDTAVVGVHRGHRLGLRLKVAMLQRILEREPDLVTIDTWNAESNDHMIAVNAELGCFVVASGQMTQHELG